MVGLSDSNFGVYGGSTSSVGVYGVSNSSYGVYGHSYASYGVYAYSNYNGAGYFDGSCYADSFVSPAAPTVRLDHPLAPATKVLTHAAVVSDAPATLYSGTVTTDAAGEATVELPGWFKALNTDLRYQLTPFADVRAWVKSKTADNRFTIATSEPGTEVCWQLTGVRRDVYATAHPLEVESAKTGKEKGRYLTPLELGQPESTGVDWGARQQARTEPPPAPAG